MRHTVDGAEILRRTPEMPILAPVVAFEHHLRLDGTGYPLGARRAALNPGTMLCSISDIYDAMRSQRAYQQAFPTERIIAVLKRNDGTQFDQHLVRDSCSCSASIRLATWCASTPAKSRSWRACTRRILYRPRVRVLFDGTGRRLDLPFERNLWSRLAPARARQRRLAGGSRRIRDRSVELPAGVTAIMSEASRTLLLAALSLAAGLHVAGLRTAAIPVSSPDRLVAELRLAQVAALLPRGLRRRISRFAATHENVPGAGLDVALALGSAWLPHRRSSAIHGRR